MRWADLPVDARDATGRIHDAIAAEAGTLGPGSEFGRSHLDDDDCAADIPDQVLCDQWVAVVAWMDPETGEHWYSLTSSPNLPTHARAGLLGMFNE